jgi:hypothetical protein
MRRKLWEYLLCSNFAQRVLLWCAEDNPGLVVGYRYRSHGSSPPRLLVRGWRPPDAHRVDLTLANIRWGIDGGL